MENWREINCLQGHWRQQALYLHNFFQLCILCMFTVSNEWTNAGSIELFILWVYTLPLWLVQSLQHQKGAFTYIVFPFLVTESLAAFLQMMTDIWYSPTAIPGSELAVCTSSLPWWRITQLGSIWAVPLGSRGTIWNFLKSVSLMALFSGHTS